MLPGTVAPATAGLLGFDSDTSVTPTVAADFFTHEYRFCMRYLSLGSVQSDSDLTLSEALCILGAGLALAPIQHAHVPNWSPTAELGTEDGGNAASHASQLGFPQGMNVWCDLEGVAGATAASQVIDYCNSWYGAVADAGYVPGLYVGAVAILDGQTLYESLKFSHYWKSLSGSVPEVAVRGYQMIQSNEHSAYGIDIDDDRTQDDSLGGAVLWLAPPPAGIT
jgi:hypothetical protein